MDLVFGLCFVFNAWECKRKREGGDDNKETVTEIKEKDNR